MTVDDKQRTLQGLNNVKANALKDNFFKDAVSLNIDIIETPEEFIIFDANIVMPVKDDNGNVVNHKFTSRWQHEPNKYGIYYCPKFYSLTDDKPEPAKRKDEFNEVDRKSDEIFNYFEWALTDEFAPEEYKD